MKNKLSVVLEIVIGFYRHSSDLQPVVAILVSQRHMNTDAHVDMTKGEINFILEVVNNKNFSRNARHDPK